jgi:hypothetical protein
MAVKLKYTTADAAWEFEKSIHESFGHRFPAPVVSDFNFCGRMYDATCERCGKRLLVSGGWGGPAAFGPCANVDCVANK